MQGILQMFVVYLDSDLCDTPGYVSYAYVIASSPEEAMQRVLGVYPQMQAYWDSRGWDDEFPAKACGDLVVINHD